MASSDDDGDFSALIERVARAIYMTHWELPDEGKRGNERLPPTWDNASGAVRDWVRKQAEAAIDALSDWLCCVKEAGRREREAV